MPVIKAPTFEQWIEHAFNHPEEDGEWSDRPESDYWGGDNLAKAEYIAETFANPDRHIARFSDRQIENGLWFIVALGGNGYLAEALEEAVPLELRLGVVRSTQGLFSKLFAKRCDHLDTGGHADLYRVCYMFWEIFPLRNSSDDPAEAALCAEKLAVMERILSMDNAMCQYAALHGFGHAHYETPERTKAVIDRYLAQRPAPAPDLHEYALKAREGSVQ